MLIPHADLGPESELQAMAPPGVRIHATRVPFGAMRTGGEMDRTIPLAPVEAFAEPPFVDDATELLAAAPVQVIAYAFTSSAYVIGASRERAMIERLRDRARGLPLVATCAAAVQALRTLKVERIALVDPPWFDQELNELGRRYYTRAGFDVVFSSPSGLPSNQASVRPEELYDWTRTHVPDTAEAVMFGGNGFRTAGVIETLEETLARPVLASNQVLLWAALHAASAPAATVTHYGCLFGVSPEQAWHDLEAGSLRSDVRPGSSRAPCAGARSL